MIKICERCNKKYNARETKQKYCSRQCHIATQTGKMLKRKGVFKVCKTCGKSFYVPKCLEKNKIYCSFKCKSFLKYGPSKEIVSAVSKCICCGKEFLTHTVRQQKYCSKKCQQHAWYSDNTPVKCRNCGKEFIKEQYRQPLFCSTECADDFQSKDILSVGRNGVRRKFIKLGLMLDKCQECGYSEHPEILGIHHNDKNGTNHSINNLVVLCPNCHSLAHKRHVINPPGSHPH